MLVLIPLTGDERAAVDDGQTAVNKLLERLASVPAPGGPASRQLGIPPAATRLPIAGIMAVLQTVVRPRPRDLGRCAVSPRFVQASVSPFCHFPQDNAG